jgi:type I restriction enzyme, S subunit
VNAEYLLDQYERVADAPDAVAKLRGFILNLAMRGKLVPQDREDSSPEACLAAAQRSLARMADGTRGQRWKPSKALKPDEAPSGIPPTWIAVRLNDTGLYVNGLAFKPSDWKPVGVPIIRIQNLTDPSKEFNFADGKFPDEVIVNDGDILVSWSATLEAFEWTRGRGVLNQHIFRVLPAEGLTTKRFLYLLLRRAIRDMAESTHAHGLVMSHINRGPFLAHAVSIPPIAEQHRIVAKVDELMALCDQLESARKKRERARDLFAAASLARLNEPDPSSYRADAHFAIDNLGSFTVRSNQIRTLRQTILNLAVRGKLVPQDPTDEPASELLRRIGKEKAQSLKANEIGREKFVKLGDRRNLPFDIRPGWEAATIGQILMELLTGPFGSSLHQSDYEAGGIPVVNPASIQNEQIVPIERMAVGTATLERLSTFKLREGDIVMGRRGEMGRCAVVTKREAGWLCGTGSLVLRLPKPVFGRYFVLLIGSPYVREYLGGSAVGATMQNLNQGILRNLVFGLPPLAEQRRIVAKVDELIALCDRLERQLTDATELRRRLFGALVSEATAGA